MDMMINLITSLIFSILDVYLIELYLRNSYQFREKAKPNVYYFIEILLCLFIHAQFLTSLVLNLSLFILLIIAISKYEISLLKFIWTLMLLFILNYGIGMLLIPIFEWLFDTSSTIFNFNWLISYTILFYIMTKYVEALFIVLIIYYEQGIIKNFKHYKNLSIFFFVYFGITVIFNNEMLFYFPSVGRSFCFIVIVYTIALIAFDHYQTKHERIEKELAIMNQNILNEKDYLRKYNESKDVIKQMRHDLKNNYHIIDGYLSDGDAKEAQRFIRKNIGKLDKYSTLIHFGIPCIDSVIDDKVQTMKKMNVHYRENISLIYIGEIEIADVALLIGLALDNAIEACEDVDSDREITFKAKCHQDYLIFHFINSIVPNSCPCFDKTNKLLYKDKHGFGVKEIKYFAKLYDGEAKYTVEDNKVILRVTLKTNS